MRTRTLLAIMLSMVVAAAISPGVAPYTSTRRPTVRVENGVVINSRAAYYFALPQGWALDNESTADRLKVLHPGSGATFHVSYDHTPGNQTMVYQSFLWSFESPDNKWLSFGKGQVTLWGRPAMGIRGTREKDGKKVKELVWVALAGESMYLIASSVSLDQFDARAPEIDLMFSSFRWGAPNDAPADRYAIRLPGEQWQISVSIPGFTVEREATRPDQTGIMMAGTNEGAKLNLSIFLEREKKPRTSEQCRKKYFQASLSSPLWKSNIRRWETETLALGQYLIKVREIVEFEQMHMHAYLGEGHVCMDLHLSKVGFEESDRSAFDQVFSSVRAERISQK